MKKIKGFVLGGIQQKVFNLVLITILLVMAAYTAVIFYQGSRLTSLVTETNDQQKEAISNISGVTMDVVLSQTMRKNTQMEALLADDLFQKPAAAVKMIAEYATKLFDDPEAYEARAYALPDASKDGKVSTQVLLEEGVDPEDKDIAERLGLIANMSEMLEALFDTAGVNSVYIALPEGVMLLADDDSASKYDEKGELVRFQMTERDWYTGAAGKGDLFFTDVASDVFTGQVGIMCGMPVYRGDELVAVAGADLYLGNMAEAVEGASQNGSFTFIVNDRGHVTFSPRKTGELMVELGDDARDLRNSENAGLADFIGDSMTEFTSIRKVEVDGEEWYMTGMPISTVGWAVFDAVSVAAADQPTMSMVAQYDGILNGAMEVYKSNLSRAKQMILVLLLTVAALAVIGALSLAKRIVKPLEAMTKRVGALGGSDLRFNMEDAYRTGDEIEVLAEAFSDLSAKTLQYIDQVQAVTAEKERIGAELSMATAIQASQLPKLFPAFPNRPEFDVFASMTPAKEVGGDFYDFFLIDDDHIGLVMADVSGKGVPAALFMMVARVLIKSRLQNGESPGEALSSVNDQLCEGNEAGLFVTVWAAVIQISTGKGIAVNAGHEHPALRKAGGQYELITYRHSLAVATMEGIPFREHSFDLHPGDSLFVYTDGVTEATNAGKELFGNERTLEALNRDPDAAPEEVLANVMDAIEGFVSGAEQFDDITMLSFKYIGPDGGKKDAAPI